MKVSSNLSQKLIILGITLLAFLLRVYRLDAQSYWIDEGWTLYSINLTFPELLRLLQTEVPKPPFHYLTSAQWIKLVGDGEFALRYYSVIFGTLAIPLVYRLGKDLAGSRAGLLTALLMAVAPYQIWHSQDARMYSIFTAASVLSMWGFVNLWQKGGWRWWLLYIIGTEWAITVHYHAVILIGIQGLFLLFTWRRHWRGYPAWGGSLLLILLVYAPWLAWGGTLLKDYLNWIQQPDSVWQTFTRSVIAYSVGELVPHSQAILLSLVFVALYGLGLVYATRRDWGHWRGPEMLALLLTYTLAPNIAAWLYGQFRTPVYLERYLIPVQVGYLLAVSLGILALAHGLPRLIRSITRQRQFKWPAAFIATIFLLGLLGSNGWVLWHHYFDPAYAKPNWRGVIRTIESFSQPGDAILLTGDGGEKLFAYYYHGNLPVYYNFNTPVPSPAEARARISQIAGQHARLWYTPYGVDIDATLETWLDENTYPAWHGWLGRKRLALYATLAPAGRTERLNTHFLNAASQGPILLRVDLPDTPTPAGDLLPLTLTWQLDQPLSTNIQFSLRLLNRHGDIFTQSDWPALIATQSASDWPANQPIPDQRSLWLPADVPPGDYTLQLVVYDPATGPLGNPVIIAGITVAPARITPPLTALTLPNATRQTLGQLSLVGYVAPESLRPGQETWLWLYWQAETRPNPQSIVRLTLSSDSEPISFDIPLRESLGPLDSWQPGQVRRAVYHLPTSPRLAGQTASLGVALISPAGTSEEITITTIDLENRPRQFEPPPVAQPLNITLGEAAHNNAGQINLIGVDVSANPSSDTVPVTLYWQAGAEVTQDYTVFVQLLNSAGQVVSQVDAPPLAGAAPTTTWLPGEIITDHYTLQLPADLPPAAYRLITGMYHAATGQRLPVSSGGDFVELPGVTVE